jgi:hypothetical protein
MSFRLEQYEAFVEGYLKHPDQGLKACEKKLKREPNNTLYLVRPSSEKASLTVPARPGPVPVAAAAVRRRAQELPRPQDRPRRPARPLGARPDPGHRRPVPACAANIQPRRRPAAGRAVEGRPRQGQGPAGVGREERLVPRRLARRILGSDSARARSPCLRSAEG